MITNTILIRIDNCQRAICKMQKQVEDFSRRAADLITANFLDGFKIPTAFKNGKTLEQRSLWFREKLVTPVNGTGEGLPPFWCVTASARQPVETAFELLEHGR